MATFASVHVDAADFRCAHVNPRHDDNTDEVQVYLVDSFGGGISIVVHDTPDALRGIATRLLAAADRGDEILRELRERAK